jgi:hypothetical protein
MCAITYSTFGHRLSLNVNRICRLSLDIFESAKSDVSNCKLQISIEWKKRRAEGNLM